MKPVKTPLAHLHVRLAPELMRRLKARALVDGRTQEQIVAEAIDRAVKPVTAAELGR